MGLSASLYSGTSGLKAHGEDMTVIGNNISNVSTIGFKGSRMYFEDALSQQITTASGGGQVGRGVSVGAVMGDFSQGSLESTTEATDLAIGGNGFFMVSPAGQELNYYTRAGNFRFDEDGFLVDPRGYRLQGWEVQQRDTSTAASGDTTATSQTGVQILGVPQDIKLENFQSPPQATSRLDLIINVDSASEDKTVSETSPFTAMFDKYDATQEIPIGEENYAYQTTIKVYDENGSSHSLTVYMDPVSNEEVTDVAGGKKYWEYIVTVPKTDDNRVFMDDTKETRGILMTGTLTFNASGQLENMSAFTVNDPGSGTVADPYTDPDAKASWVPANFSQNGYPIFTANFLGTEDGSTTGSGDLTESLNTKNIELNFGVRNKTTTWDPGPTTQDPIPAVTGQATLAGLSGIDTTGLSASELGTINGMDGTEISALSSTNFSTGSTTIFQAQDGYTAGFLQNISVDRDGVITGRYSNGQVLQLYAVTLATFNNNYALYREGGNLFSETRSSGPPITGLANTGGKGSIASNSLEQSNVDLATEFVKMITTEKGFQANSKTITTVDQMLSVLIQLKR